MCTCQDLRLYAENAYAKLGSNYAAQEKSLWILLLRKVPSVIELAAFTLANSHYHVLDSSATFGHSFSEKKLSDLSGKALLDSTQKADNMQATPPSALSSELTIHGCWRIRCFAESLTQERCRYRICLRNPSIHELQAQFHKVVVLMEPCSSRNQSSVVHVLPALCSLDSLFLVLNEAMA